MTIAKKKISPLLFVMSMEIILRGARDTAQGEELEGGIVLPPMRAFMDDITTLVRSEQDTRDVLNKLQELFTRCRMKVKPKKSRSLTIIKGKVKETCFYIDKDPIPVIPVCRGKKVQKLRKSCTIFCKSCTKVARFFCKSCKKVAQISRKSRKKSAKNCIFRQKLQYFREKKLIFFTKVAIFS